MKEVVVYLRPKIEDYGIEDDDGEVAGVQSGADMVVEGYGEMEEFTIRRRDWDVVSYEILDNDDPNFEGESGSLESGCYRLNGDRLERCCKKGGWKDYEEFLREEETRAAMECEDDFSDEDNPEMYDDDDEDDDWDWGDEAEDWNEGENF